MYAILFVISCFTAVGVWTVGDNVIKSIKRWFVRRKHKHAYKVCQDLGMKMVRSIVREERKKELMNNARLWGQELKGSVDNV